MGQRGKGNLLLAFRSYLILLYRESKIFFRINPPYVYKFSSRPVIRSMSQVKLFSWGSVVPKGLEGLLYQSCLMTVPTGLITASPPYSVKQCHVKGKAYPLQAWNGPEGSRKLRFPDFMTTVQGGGKVFSLKHRPHLTPENSPGIHFC